MLLGILAFVDSLKNKVNKNQHVISKPSGDGKYIVHYGFDRDFGWFLSVTPVREDGEPPSKRPALGLYEATPEKVAELAARYGIDVDARELYNEVVESMF